MEERVIIEFISDKTRIEVVLYTHVLKLWLTDRKIIKANSKFFNIVEIL